MPQDVSQLHRGAGAPGRQFDISLPASITEDQIAILGALKGTTNSEAIELDGSMLDPSSLVFAGFAGGLNVASDRYEGRVRFDRRKNPHDDTPPAAWIGVVPNVAAVPAQEPPAAEPPAHAE